MKINLKFILIVSLLLISPSLYAYIGPGPGTGVGAITVVLGILASILIAVFGIIYYPIKRWLKNKKKQQK